MRIILIGSPDSNKRKIAFEIQERLPYLRIMGFPTPLWRDDREYALGELADYRAEIFLLGERALSAFNKDAIFTHTVLDSLAHIAARIHIKSEYNLDDEKWFDLLLIAGATVRDSLIYDVAIFINSDPENYFDQCVLEAHQYTLKELGIDSIKISSEPDYDKLIDDIEHEATRQRTDQEESNSKD